MSNNIQNLHLITAKILPVTNNKPSRIRLKSKRFNQSIIISRGEDETWYKEVILYLSTHFFNIVGIAEIAGNEFALLSTTFKPLRDKIFDRLRFITIDELKELTLLKNEAPSIVNEKWDRLNVLSEKYNNEYQTNDAFKQAVNSK